MNILFWYILRQYLKILTMCLAGLTTIYLVVDFFEKLRKFLRYDAELVTMVMYFFFKIPDISFKLVPFASLMASLLAVGLLNKNHEITAMRSCGVSIIHVTMPFLAVAAFATTILFGFAAVVMPLANAKAEYIKTVDIQNQPQPLSFTAENLWLHIQNNSIMHVRRIAPDGTQLHAVALYRLDNHFHVAEVLTAARAEFHDGRWSLHDVAQRSIEPKGPVTMTQRPTLPFDLSLTPKDLQEWMSLEPEYMTLEQLMSHVKGLRQKGLSISRFLTDYWGRVAFAFVTLVMTILGVSIGLLRMGTRHTSIAKGVGQALAISFLFWTTHSIGIALGRSGALPPVVAGWIACFTFLIVGLNLFLRVRY